MDVLAGVEDEMDGVEGGVLMLMAPCRDPLGELEVSMGEGMLYLQIEMHIVSGTHSHVFREFKRRTFCARGEPDPHPSSPTGWPSNPCSPCRPARDCCLVRCCC